MYQELDAHIYALKILFHHQKKMKFPQMLYTCKKYSATTINKHFCQLDAQIYCFKFQYAFQKSNFLHTPQTIVSSLFEAQKHNNPIFQKYKFTLEQLQLVQKYYLANIASFFKPGYTFRRFKFTCNVISVDVVCQFNLFLL